MIKQWILKLFKKSKIDYVIKSKNIQTYNSVEVFNCFYDVTHYLKKHDWHRIKYGHEDNYYFQCGKYPRYLINAWHLLNNEIIVSVHEHIVEGGSRYVESFRSIGEIALNDSIKFIQSKYI